MGGKRRESESGVDREKGGGGWGVEREREHCFRGGKH